jgi:hypothetical protein
MFDDEDELAEAIVYKPCRACGSDKYDNADCPEPEFTDDGKINFQPTRCDQCDFSLVLSDSDYIH